MSLPAPFPPLVTGGDGLDRYPADADALAARLAQVYVVRAERVLPVRGVTHGLELVWRLAARDGGSVQAPDAEPYSQLADLPRAAIARASLSEGRIIRVKGTAEAAEVANLYGPEHLSIQTADADNLVDRITAAGAVFVGTWAAETLGDYAAGPSHVLPTDGAARAFSGVSTGAFMTAMSVQQVSRDGARVLGPVAARLARLEGLEAHARAADLRSAL